MPPKSKPKECLVILINVGGTDKTENENESSFLTRSKLVAQHLIQRRIFLRPKDEIGVIVIGTSKTRNRLFYDNIVEMGPLQIPNWDLVKSVMRLRGTNESGNWVDGMSVMVEYLKTECVEENTSKTVVLLTDFKEDPAVIKQYDIDTIVSEIKEAGVSLLAIGNKNLDANSEIEMNPSEELFANVCKMVEGKSTTFDDAVREVMIYKDKAKTAMPWKVDMDLFDIEIPIIMYLKTTEDFKLPKWQLYTDAGDDQVPVERSRALVDRNREELSQDEIITGYMYGRKFIPFSDEDKAALQYKSGPKGFMIYGFTKQSYIRMDCLAGKGSYIVVPAQQWASPFYSLVKAMADKNKVAIVRRVYRANLAPKMGVLIPHLHTPGQPWCLVYIELVFAEDRRIVQEKPLKSTMQQLSKEQDGAVDNLIDSMMLMEVLDVAAGEKKEAFKAGTVPDVSRQHVWDKLAHRALNPDSPLPPMSDYLKKFLQPPQYLQEKAEPVLEKVKALFPMKPVQKKKYIRKKSQTGSQNPGPSSEDAEQSIQRENTVKEKSSAEIVAESANASDEELSQIAESVEAASQAMEIDLDELANDM